MWLWTNSLDGQPACLTLMQHSCIVLTVIYHVVIRLEFIQMVCIWVFYMARSHHVERSSIYHLPCTRKYPTLIRYNIYTKLGPLTTGYPSPTSPGASLCHSTCRQEAHIRQNPHTNHRTGSSIQGRKWNPQFQINWKVPDLLKTVAFTMPARHELWNPLNEIVFK